MNWQNFEKCWRDEGEINIKRLCYLLFLNGTKEENPYKIIELLYKNIGEENILKRRVKGEDVYSINSNKTRLADWLLFEKEWIDLGFQNQIQIKSLILKYKLKTSFAEVYKRFARRIMRKYKNEIVFFKIIPGFDNQGIEDETVAYREEVTGIE